MAIKSIQQLEDRLTGLKYSNVKRISGKRVAILTNENRINLLEQIQKHLKLDGAKYTKSVSGSSIGGVVLPGGYTVLAKPLSKQGAMSAGTQNEYALNDNINNFVKDNGGQPLKIVFVAGTSKYVIPDATGAEITKADTKGNKKADVVIKGPLNKKYPISIKKDNAEYWGTTETYYGARAREVINKAVEDGKVKFTDKGSYYTLEPAIAVKAINNDDIDYVVFGSDIKPDGAVITSTFVSSDFNYDGKSNTLTIKVSSIITKKSDIPDSYYPYFIIRNSRARNSKALGYPGLIVQTAYKKRVKGNVYIAKE
jgi:hypothetical protein